MKKQNLLKFLPVVMVIVIAATFALTGCKKKMPKEEAPPPPPPKVEEVKPVAPDTTGDAAKKEQEMMTADQARIQTVYFDYDKSDIKPEERSKITTDAEILRKWSKWTVSLEGHCDERGTAEYNLALGERRAKAVEKALSAEGIEATRVTTISYGKERPADPGHTESAWSKNRRVEVKAK